jgi:hypothetical protein
LSLPVAAENWEAITSEVVLTFPAATGVRGPVNVSGAVGPHHVVSASQSGVVIQNRSGAVLASYTLQQFFELPVPPQGTLRPRVVYDATADRWIAVSHSRRLAVSESGDPAGEWRRYFLSTTVLRAGEYSNLVITDDLIVIAADDDGHPIDFWSRPATLITTVRKNDLYAMPATLPIQWHAPADNDRLLVPVAGESNVAYLLDYTERNRLLLNRLDTILGSWMVVPPVPLAGQRDVIDTAVEKTGWIYFAKTVQLIPPRVAIVWGRFHPESGAFESGVIFPKVFGAYLHPSLAVNDRGVMVIGFSMDSASMPWSSGYVVRDPSGTVSEPVLIAEGDSVPVQTPASFGSYTATVVDPIDDSVFWTVQMRAKEGGWETVWAKIETASLRRRTVRK